MAHEGAQKYLAPKVAGPNYCSSILAARVMASQTGMTTTVPEISPQQQWPITTNSYIMPFYAMGDNDHWYSNQDR
jgi:hypothetical protein